MVRTVVDDHLAANGVVAINAGRTETELRIFAATAVPKVMAGRPDLAMEPWTDDKAPIKWIVHRIVRNWLVTAHEPVPDA